MKKIQKTSELLWVLGTLFVALGVAICSKANLGVSMIAAPAFIIQEALAAAGSAITVGVVEYLFQGLMLVVLCVVIRRFNWRYLLAFAEAVLYGYALNLFLWVFQTVTFDAVWLRWVMLIVGDVCISFGVACFFRTYLPLQVYELFVSEFSARFRLNITKVKWTFDFVLLAISVTLAVVLFGDLGSFDWSAIGYANFHSIGLGTVVTAIINSPVIAWSGKLLDRILTPTAAFPKVEKVLKRSGFDAE